MSARKIKKVSKRILIICEGWTEHNYAKALKGSLEKEKQRGIEIKILKPDGKTNIEQLFKKAEEYIQESKRNGNEYDLVWIFFDNDKQNLKKKLSNLVKKGDITKFFDFNNYFSNNNKNDLSLIKFAYSSLCIEHWFIIHFKEKCSGFNESDEAKKELNNLWKKEFNEEYKKTGQNHFEKLKEKLEDAIKRARKIRKQGDKNIPILDRNPYFTLDEFIEFFRKHL
jgi:hypothetical protein